MNKEKLQEILEKHRLWLEDDEEGERADLRGVDLQGVDLQGTDLRMANLQRTNLQRANLEGANLEGAYLRRANLEDTNLQRANLQRAILEGANLQRTNLRGANLQWADFRGADFRGADLEDANLQRAILEGANLEGAYLRGANLQWALIDFSYWPLWCGSLDVKVDVWIARQLAYHLCRLDCDDEEYLKVRDAIKDFANKFHRVEECGRIELKVENKPEVTDYWQGLLSEGEEYDV